MTKTAQELPYQSSLGSSLLSDWMSENENENKKRRKKEKCERRRDMYWSFRSAVGIRGSIAKCVLISVPKQADEKWKFQYNTERAS